MAKCRIERTDKGLIIHYTCKCGSRMRLETYKKPDRLPVCFECAIPITKLFPDLLNKTSHNKLHVPTNKEKRKHNSKNVYSAQEAPDLTLF